MVLLRHWIGRYELVLYYFSSFHIFWLIQCGGNNSGAGLCLGFKNLESSTHFLGTLSLNHVNKLRLAWYIMTTLRSFYLNGLSQMPSDSRWNQLSLARNWRTAQLNCRLMNQINAYCFKSLSFEMVCYMTITPYNNLAHSNHTPGAQNDNFLLIIIHNLSLLYVITLYHSVFEHVFLSCLYYHCLKYLI